MRQPCGCSEVASRARGATQKLVRRRLGATSPMPVPGSAASMAEATSSRHFTVAMQRARSVVARRTSEVGMSCATCPSAAAAAPKNASWQAMLRGMASLSQKRAARRSAAAASLLGEWSWPGRSSQRAARNAAGRDTSSGAAPSPQAPPRSMQPEPHLKGGRIVSDSQPPARARLFVSLMKPRQRPVSGSMCRMASCMSARLTQ
mmetsp:Transcript_96124/g.267014  ORF Transcript_96124/g.267014 Transcript_96124/m.267014 type:complete len:204 (-) Transcript_96124:449-1060(-)